MRHFSLVFGVCVAGLLLGARPAAADIPPRGACQLGEIGQACDEAVDEAGEIVGSGICVAEQCTRALPSGAMTYDCAICRPQPAEPGAGGAGNDPVKPTAGDGNDPAKPTAEADDNGGCTMSPGERGAGSAALASLLGLGLALARRRSSQARA